jgi:ACR3 family arsenite efflux pump ArsB
MNKNLLQSIRPLILVFIFFTAFFISGKSWLDKKGADQNVLIIGNLLLFLISLTAFLITNKALSSSNPQAFVRAMYGSFIIKFFVLAITAFVYIMVAKKNVNKPALIACAGLYIIYTGIETRALMKMLKQKKNG